MDLADFQLFFQNINFLCNVPQVSSNIKAAIRNHRDTLEGDSLDGRGQPLIVLQGPSKTDIKSVYVSIASLLYPVDSVVQALDVCFKLFHALHASYPLDSCHIWVMLQRAVYKFKTEWDAASGIEYSWINAYKKYF